ncbi:transmembrane protein, putative (macronuclear) [Tetrahymena thermophila SB210]|uniref:Transmembrane protein, putative n=1 Tax=Tetrahymena thermophila (strain SB210) TaxID=312017 RepID=W7X7V6_TETTS|nr:transmembrane protein, putative [Tetrahymena thermophila SB210]EWS75460.1 transmembrane protein, putative [Tetrahymena thermophila SB210]|eukprot:XP_012652007.1 transmembrane protein, putative [Tetrahymena thermophila SB210]
MHYSKAEPKSDAPISSHLQFQFFKLIFIIKNIRIQNKQTVFIKCKCQQEKNEEKIQNNKNQKLIQKWSQNSQKIFVQIQINEQRKKIIFIRKIMFFKQIESQIYKKYQQYLQIKYTKDQDEEPNEFKVKILKTFFINLYKFKGYQQKNQQLLLLICNIFQSIISFILFFQNIEEQFIEFNQLIINGQNQQLSNINLLIWFYEEISLKNQFNIYNLILKCVFKSSTQKYIQQQLEMGSQLFIFEKINVLIFYIKLLLKICKIYF